MIDPIEKLLTGLRPAAPSAELMARLQAARPKRRGSFQFSVFGFQYLQRALTSRRVAWIGGVVAAAAVLVASQWSGPRADHRLAGEPAAASPVAESMPDQDFQVFLPVESTRTLVSLQPARLTQEPDESPQRFVRAVWVDDVTAVGAETDAALHLRRAHEAYVPVSSPVY